MNNNANIQRLYTLEKFFYRYLVSGIIIVVKYAFLHKLTFKIRELTCQIQVI